MTNNDIPLCITLGDPLGIGPEITARTLNFLQKKKINLSFIVIGSKKAFYKACENLNINNELINIMEFIDYNERIEFLNRPSIVGGSISYNSICKAAELYKNKIVKAIITAPISKESLHLAGHKFDGHTGLLGSLFNIEEPYLMLANKIFSTLHVTCHKSLLEAIKLITKEKIIEVINIGHEHMLKINKTEPRIAVCGLNPHAGENGIFGSEEINEIIPAVELLKKKGLNIVGPISPDIIFREAVKKKFDLVIANYHDQGHIPVKLLYFDQSVNVTLGVPFIRTSVDHGTAFDIAYKNKASAKNMLNAIFYALKMSNFQ
tara:strand:+ start:41 stop:997 length:957 start_codon:yes stop_codon:yes gene_type:complete